MCYNKISKNLFKFKPMEGEKFTTKESMELLQRIAKNMVMREDVDQIVNNIVQDKK